MFIFIYIYIYINRKLKIKKFKESSTLKNLTFKFQCLELYYGFKNAFDNYSYINIYYIYSYLKMIS